MKASFALVLAGSLLASAGPIKRAAIIHTDYVTDIVYVTVTVDPTTALHTTTTHSQHKTKTLQKTTTKTSTTSSSTSSSTSTTPTIILTPTTTAVPTTATPTPTTTAQVQDVVTITEGAPTTTAATATTETAEVQAAAAKTPAAKEKTTTSSTKTAATTTAATSSSQPTDYSSTAVYHHNLHRANHSAPAASWDSDLASYAATVAATCVFAHDLTPGGGGYGQNIAVYGASGDVESISSSKMIAQAVTDMWYNGELAQYPEDGYGQSSPDMSNFESWGHFSQVVWAASTKVGCATQYCAAGTIYSSMASWYSVCDYRSTGNVGGEYGDNVLPPLGLATVTA